MFLFKITQKNLDPYYKTDLDFLRGFGRKNKHLIAELIPLIYIYGVIKEGKCRRLIAEQLWFSLLLLLLLLLANTKTPIHIYHKTLLLFSG